MAAKSAIPKTTLKKTPALKAIPADFGNEKSPVRERMAKALKTKHHSRAK